MNRSFYVKPEAGLLNALGTPCHVSQAFNPANGIPERPRVEFAALWDTGATHSIITPKVVEALGLKPLRRIRQIFTRGVNGLDKSEAFLINLSLPDKVNFNQLTVFLKEPGDVWWDVLVGMDVISQGQFSIKNVNSNTEWSFSYALPEGAA
jgi:predicted aspartyl protease